MMQKILQLIEENQVIDSPKQLEQILLKLNNIIDHEYFLLGISLQPTLVDGKTLIIDNYPASWREQYDESGFMHVDPIVKYSMSHFLPVRWDMMTKSLSKPSVIFEEARCNGLNAGFSIPIHGLRGEFGMLSFATSDSKAYNVDSARIATSQLIVPLLTQNIHNIVCDIRDEEHLVSLTNREVQCLTWAAEGKSAWEIAAIIGCSERTAKFHISNACNKLGATNRYQAITKAILGGHIHPHI